MTNKEPPYYHFMLAFAGAIIGRLFKLVENAFHEYVVEKIINKYSTFKKLHRDKKHETEKAHTKTKN